MGGAIPGLVVLGSLRKQAVQAMRSKSVNPRFERHINKQIKFLAFLSKKSIIKIV